MGTHNKLSSISYRIIRSKRKSISIKITNKGEVIIASPINISEATIEDLVKKKIGWITDNLEIVNTKNKSMKNIGFTQGQQLLWMGKTLEVQVNKTDIKECHIKVLDAKLIIYINSKLTNKNEVIREKILSLYKNKAKEVLVNRTCIYSKILKVYPNKITIKDQKTIWGSCSSKKNINFSYRLIMAPMEVLDYVVVHELCHIVHMNHSKTYWELVKSIIPDYKEKREWLKNNGYMLSIGDS